MKRTYKKRKITLINCIVCGKEIKTQSGRRIYCDGCALIKRKKNLIKANKKTQTKKRVEHKKDMFCCICGKSLIEENSSRICCHNPECQKEYHQRTTKKYYRENKEKCKVAIAKWYKEHPEKHRAYSNYYNKTHRKERAEYAKKYTQRKMEEWKKIGKRNNK